MGKLNRVSEEIRPKSEQLKAREKIKHKTDSDEPKISRGKKGET